MVCQLNLDFTEAGTTIHTVVVHVKCFEELLAILFRIFYGYKGGQSQEQVGTGSGVIISGYYIVTNNV
jgi:S1-C subfamily serine protease